MSCATLFAGLAIKELAVFIAVVSLSRRFSGMESKVGASVLNFSSSESSFFAASVAMLQ